MSENINKYPPDYCSEGRLLLQNTSQTLPWSMLGLGMLVVDEEQPLEEGQVGMVGQVGQVEHHHKEGVLHPSP